MSNFLNKTINNPFIALKNPNYLIYWCAFCVSTIGTWMQNIAQPWLAYSLTGSPLLLSLIGVLQYTPVLLFSLFAGVLLDRFPKKKIILITQACSCVLTAIPAFLIWTDQIQYWHIAVLAVLIGIVNSFDITARQTFVIEIVGKQNTMNAVALNSAVFNSARIIGPALAGVIMGFTSIAWCFFFNSLSFVIMLISMLFVKPSYIPEKSPKRPNVFVDIKDGILYMTRENTLFRTMLTVAIVAIFGMNFQVLVPVFTKVILKGQETSFGFLMSFMGVGSLLGALGVATTSKSGPRPFNLNVMPWLIAVMIILTGFMNSFAMVAACLLITGFCFVSFSSSSNSNVQMNSKDQYRGRIMSIYTLVFAGSTPIGNIYTGFITDHFGPRVGYFACGGVMLVLLCVFHIFNKRKKGEAIKVETLVPADS